MLEKDTYDRVAEKYDQDWSGIYAQARAHCVEQITDQLATQNIPQIQSILELVRVMLSATWAGKSS